MPYQIDSDVAIDVLDGATGAVALIERIAPDGVAISVITYMEVYQGTERGPRPEEARAKLREILEGIPILPVTPAIAERCAILRESLARQGRRVRPRALDLLVAATALEHELTLVTRNRDDYKDIPGLTLY